jgi:hypothetical protein
MFQWLRETYGTSADLLGAELIGGVNRVNYNQDNQQLNALAGVLCCAVLGSAVLGSAAEVLHWGHQGSVRGSG